MIPDKETRTEELATTTKHKFRVKRSKWRLKLTLQDADGEPLANEPFVLRIPGSERSKTRPPGMARSTWR